jgi:hypothetical protein
VVLNRCQTAARYNWCHGPVPDRGPGVEKHWRRRKSSHGQYSFLLAGDSVRLMLTRQTRTVYTVCIAEYSKQEFRYLSSGYMPYTVVREVADQSRRTGLILAKCVLNPFWHSAAWERQRVSATTFSEGGHKKNNLSPVLKVPRQCPFALLLQVCLIGFMARLIDCWPSPAQWFLFPSPTGLMSIFYYLLVLRAFRLPLLKHELLHIR